jgi:hypothetical protein
LAINRRTSSFFLVRICPVTKRIIFMRTRNRRTTYDRDEATEGYRLIKGMGRDEGNCGVMRDGTLGGASTRPPTREMVDTAYEDQQLLNIQIQNGYFGYHRHCYPGHSCHGMQWFEVVSWDERRLRDTRLRFAERSTHLRINIS